MSRMTRADFIRLCTAGCVALVQWPRYSLLAATNNSALPRVHAQRVIEHLAERPTDRAPVVTSVALSPDAQLVATAGDDHLVRLWSLPGGELKYQLRDHTDWVRSTSFDPQGLTLATAGEDRAVRLWDVQQGKLLRTLPTHTLGIRSIRFSPNGQTIAAAGFDEQVRIYHAQQGQQLSTFPAPCPDMRAVAFSRTGELMAAGGRDGRLRLYRMNAEGELPVVSAHTQRLRALSFSPDGNLLATAGEDQQVLIWNLQTIKPQATFVLHGNKIMSLTWCGSRVVAAGGSDNLIHMLDLNTQQEVAVLVGHTGTIAALDADPTGRLLVSGSFDTTARVWNIEQIVNGATTARTLPVTDPSTTSSNNSEQLPVPTINSTRTSQVPALEITPTQKPNQLK